MDYESNKNTTTNNNNVNNDITNSNNNSSSGQQVHRGEAATTITTPRRTSSGVGVDRRSSASASSSFFRGSLHGGGRGGGYDVSGTMDRLRFSLMGDMTEDKWLLTSRNSSSFDNNNNNNNNMMSSPSCYNNNNNDSNDNKSSTSIITESTSLLGGDQNDSSSIDKKQRIQHQQEQQQEQQQYCHRRSSHHPRSKRIVKIIKHTLYQIPAILLIGIFHLMVGIPFGVSYFPIGWRSSMMPTDNTNPSETDAIESTTTAISLSSDTIHGLFPLPGKEALGIRMFLFSTIIGQIIFTFFSGFHNPIGLQMVENVPFCHELSQIAIFYQGYTIDALSTIFVMFGLSSIIVGIVFYLLGICKLGRVVYYFPKHVLVGCIGGIGIYIAKTGLEVTMDASFTIYTLLFEKFHLIRIVFFFEIALRIFERLTHDKNTGHAKYPLLAPIYFCSITPIFYVMLFICNIPLDDAIDDGYFFPRLDNDEMNNNNNIDDCIKMTSLHNNDNNAIQQQHDCVSSSSTTTTSTSFLESIFFNEDLFDIWTVIHLPTVSIPAIIRAIPTMIALILFSLIHVPINIPAFAISSNSDVDMNQELISHGYSNIAAGMFGGLQNYMAYTQSVLYHKSGGNGKVSGIAVAVLTSFLFFVGPTIASYIPRCMAGCLLLHVGIDLFLEGVYDSYGKFDFLEYTGIWLITIIMTLYGMEAAMIAGFVAAISTYAVQNTSYVDPIRGSMSATTLRSSHFQRSEKAMDILSDPDLGRSRILVIQLQGHLFFGNMAHLSDDISRIIADKYSTGIGPWIVIIDFGLVLGIDSSAAQAVSKVRTTMQRDFNVDLCIFVSGSTAGFPTSYNLTMELSSNPLMNGTSCVNNDLVEMVAVSSGATGLLNPPKVPRPSKYSGSHVFVSLDEALLFAENALIARQDPSLLDNCESEDRLLGAANEKALSLVEEQELLLQNVTRLAHSGTDPLSLQRLVLAFERDQPYHEGDYIWHQGSPGNCAKVIVRGKLMAILEDEAGTMEQIAHGNMLGELGLVEDLPRMSSVVTVSEEAVLYSISRESYEQLAIEAPNAARIIDKICIRYISARVQHVSNRIFETRCLPV